MTDLKNEKRYYFYCLPYLNMGEINEINLGFASIWNFDKLASKKVKDARLRKHLEDVLNGYKEKNGRFENPVRGIGIVSIKGAGFKELSEDETQLLNDARNIVFLSYISQCNTHMQNLNAGHMMWSSENFELTTFSLTIGSEYITERTGYIIDMRHGGIKVSESTVYRPRFVPNSTTNLADRELFDAILNLKDKKPRVFRRIISSINIFRESYYNATNLSEKARILLQASAFETLTKTEPNEARRRMKELVRSFANLSGDKLYNYSSKRRNGTDNETGTIKEWWVEKFFVLRNDIAHGNSIPQKNFLFRKQRHFDIAVLFFVFFVKRFIERSLPKISFGDDLVWESWVDHSSSKEKTVSGFNYKSFGTRAINKLIKQAFAR